MQPYRQEELFHFRYNLETKVVEHDDRLVEAYGIKKIYGNMPYDFANEHVYEEDREEYINIYKKLDAGEPFVTCDFRVKGSEVWSRVCIYRDNADFMILKGVVQDVSAHYNEIARQFEEHEQEKNRRIGLELEAMQLMRGISDTYDMIISVNLTQNTYYMVSYDRYLNQGAQYDGVFDDLIDIGVSSVPDSHKESFFRAFSRDSLLEAYAQGKTDVYLEHQQYDDQGKVHWIATHVIFTKNPHNGDILEITLSQNIDERIRKEAENQLLLQEALREAEASNNAKSEFLSRMSHDIRTPMNAIQGFLQILKKNLQDEAMVSDVIEKIERSSDTLSKLLGDVLELSRIESGKVDVNYAIVDLREQAQKLTNMFENILTERQVEFAVDINVSNLHVWVDELKLTQICMNMLSNARKFTPTGGKIILGMEQSHCSRENYETYRFYVRDTGIGMSEEFQKIAFEQFEREHSYTASGVVGSGLGMAIIKKLTELMGGSCELQSELGKGTEIAAVFELQTASVAEKQTESREYENVDFNGRRVLLAEDNEFNREIAHFVLENMGFSVEDAEDGYVAVNKLLNAPDGYFDLVLMDIQMPNMDGYTATREIRRIHREAVANVPIIAMTANAFQEDKERCLEAGMNSHVAKPIDSDVLVKEINKVL